MKKTKKKEIPQNSKKTVKGESYSSDGEKIIWRFDRIDRSGKFAFDLSRADFEHRGFLEKLISYSSMTWQEVKKQTHDNRKSKHHLLSLETLSKDAYDRFMERHLEEYSDSIFSFALENKLRLVGIRENAHFYVLWYDPQHEICPSKKKHT